MANRLANEKSPYLLQHADNPVDWYPYGAEALERARREDRPLLISIGYSACHWCHVMAHESFEDPAVAALMNGGFVNVKVDREERPDVDAIYMEAVQGMTGHGGWPLNVFTTPDGQPFFGGTYFPPVARHGLPSWTDVLEGVSAAYRDRRGEVLESAQSITDYIRRAQNLAATPGDLDAGILSEASAGALAQIDWTDGGFGPAPKFPQPLALDFLLRMWKRFGSSDALAAVRLTLDHMASGGIYDHLGGGFHRYSVDRQWLVPHFEKMLYDNALLARVYLHAYQAEGQESDRHVVEETLDYLLRDMHDPDGGFYSAEDADSEGIEGKFYVWTPEELARVLPSEDAAIAAARFGVTPAGNFEGATILTSAASPEEIAAALDLDAAAVRSRLPHIREQLLAAREKRVRPGKDTKILVSWNALVIRSLAEAAVVLGRSHWLDAAEGAANFILDRMRPGGRLVRSYREGPSTVPAFLEDYSFLVEALISLYESTFDPDWLRRAEDLAAEMSEVFADPSGGAFYDSAAGDDIVVRPRSFFDNPIPAGNSAAASGLLRLHALTGNDRYLHRALPVFYAVREVLPRAPLGFAYLLSALDFYLGPVSQVAIAGDPKAPDSASLLAEVRRRYLPNAVLAAGGEDEVPLLVDRNRIEGRATVYVCRNFACNLPVTSAEELGRQLDASPNGQ